MVKTDKKYWEYPFDKNGGTIYKPEPNWSDGSSQSVSTGMIMIPIDDQVALPFTKVSIRIEHPDSISFARKAYKEHEPAFFFLAPPNMPEETEYVTIDEIKFCRGSIGKILELQNSGDNCIYILVETYNQGSILDIVRRVPYLRGNILSEDIAGIVPESEKSESEKISSMMNLYSGLANYLSEEDKKQLLELFNSFPSQSVSQFHFMIQNSPLSAEARYELLEATSYEDRRAMFIEMMEAEVENMKFRAEIHKKTMGEIANRQKEDFLRMQMHQIREELGEGDFSEQTELEERARGKQWSEAAAKRFDKEFRKLLRFNSTTPDYAVQYTYLDTYLNLPWNHCDNSSFSLENVEEILNRDHYGLDKVKERIIEQMAVLKLRGDVKAPILCLYGPPGVGKTSLGKSIAEALGRKYVRVALGGVHDEAEIRGHRRTYLGSMPGRILSALEKCGTSDPVMVLDEIDKLGADYKGDPSTALLEVLDPEQNCKFHDNYIDQDYDLSKVLFIATANSLSPISRPLLDRMELIEIGGYVEEEKLEIAKRHLIGRNLTEHGFGDDELSFEDDAIRYIIENYTRESGVRKLEKRIQSLIRKIARFKASDKDFPHNITIAHVKEYLGEPDSYNDKYENNDIPGVVTGLAWTQSGGEILFIESSTSPGKDGKLTMTGNLGDVMKESAILALQYIKSNAHKLGLSENQLEYGTVHIHVPEGAVPKDGPSAGVTIVTSLASTFTGRKVRSHLAMTGEITLRGRVLPVGGIKEKILAAKRAGIKTILMSSKNRKDVDEIKPEYISGLEFHFVDSVEEVLDFALLP